MRLGTLCLVVALATPARAAEPTAAVGTFSLEDLGLGETIRRHDVRASVTLALPTRADRVLTAAQLSLTFAPGPVDPTVAGLEVLVNQERVDLADANALADPRRTRTIAIPAALIGEHNSLTLRLLLAQAGGCGERVAAGAWSLLAGGELEIRSSPLRLPNDLAILPMPFYDEAFDRHASVAVVFPRAPGSAELRVGALVASWIGLRGGGRFTFPVTVGPVPAGHAVVLVEGPADAAALGLEAPAGPTLRMIDNPRTPGGADKLLVVSGRDAAELEAAALALSEADAGRLKGPLVAVASSARPAAAAPYDAPRWLALRPFLPLGDIPGGQALIHEGTQGATLRLPFRLPPDLFFWLTENPSLDLSYSEVLGPGDEPARVNVELNGNFLGTLPTPSRGHTRERVRLPINREHLSGYNELLIHVDHGASSCGAAPGGGSTRFAIDGGASGFRLEHYSHFASLPDLSLFVHDGFPFTRRPDLAETVAVLPDQPEPAEIATMLSLVAGFAAVTGRTASQLEVTSASELLRAPGPPRDLLVIGTASHQPLARAFAERMPLRLDGDGLRLVLPARDAFERVRLALAGRLFDGEIGRGEDALAHLQRFAAAVAIESPLAPGRSAVFVTAADAASMPTLAAMQGPAQSRFRGGDVLVLGLPGDERAMFRLGLSYQSGSLRPWHAFLWLMSQHWVVLFPSALLGMLALAVVLRSALRVRVRERLHAEAAP